MENIARIKERCVGCKSCEQSCPKHCISMVENNEGLPVTLIEAQASGLHCVVSKNISGEVVINFNQMCMLSLSDTKNWIKKICNIYFNADREQGYEKIQNAGYNINFAVRRLKNIYDKEERCNENKI